VTAEAPSAADASRSFDEGACGFIARAASADRFVDAVAAAANGSCYVDPALAFDVITARSRRARRASPFGLTPAEIAVLSQLPLGRTNREIGAALNISENTVKTHLSSVMRKIGARDRAEAAAFVVRHELTR
jgi:DNA-binding NarL/FixJ family response regulator